MSDLKIIPLPKDQWKGTPILMRYTAEEYFDVEVTEDPDSFHIDLVKKKFETPVTHRRSPATSVRSPFTENRDSG